MKLRITGVLSVFLLLTCLSAWAAEEPLANAFQRGDTYIRYHLAPEALQSQNETETTFTLTHRTIDTIDAYFECIPEMLLNESIAEPRLFEVQLDPGVPEYRQYVLPSSDSSTSFPLMTFWNIGNLAVSLGYDEFAPTKMLSDSWSSQPNKQAVTGQLSFPLGETGFSLGASLIMQAVEMQTRASTESLQGNPEPPFSITADIPATLGYAIADIPGNISLQEQMDRDLMPSGVSLSGTRNTVAGALNVSGAVKGIQVFTEVGFASGTEEYEGPFINGDVTTSDFYAVGGANYTVGQVTLGFEAGFENGEDLIEGSESLGFENDFFVENLLPDPKFGGQTETDKVYASVSAKLSPTERMTIGGTFTYVQPLSASVEPYGFEVDGAFYYSLTNYLKYLAKAGMSTPSNSFEESQYKFINNLELTF
jgi:hypothetical protein